MYSSRRHSSFRECRALGEGEGRKGWGSGSLTLTRSRTRTRTVARALRTPSPNLVEGEARKEEDHVLSLLRVLEEAMRWGLGLGLG